MIFVPRQRQAKPLGQRTPVLLTDFQMIYVNRVFRDGCKSATLGDQSHRDAFLDFNPKAGVAYEFNRSALVYFDASRSFQPPSFDESLTVVEGTGGGQAFHELNAQQAITLELGTRGERGPLEWDPACIIRSCATSCSTRTTRRASRSARSTRRARSTAASRPARRWNSRMACSRTVPPRPGRRRAAARAW